MQIRFALSAARRCPNAAEVPVRLALTCQSYKIKRSTSDLFIFINLSLRKIKPYVSNDAHTAPGAADIPKQTRHDAFFALAGVLTLQDKAEEATEWIEKGLPLSVNEKQKANALAATLPHTRESRKVIRPLISQDLDDTEIEKKMNYKLTGKEKAQRHISKKAEHKFSVL